MFESNVQEPRVFIQALRQFHGTEPSARGDLLESRPGGTHRERHERALYGRSHERQCAWAGAACGGAVTNFAGSFANSARLASVQK